MREVITKPIVYVIDDGSMRRVYRTERRTKKETPYFYIKNNKAKYLTAAEVSEFPDDWLQYIPVRNN